MSDEQKHREAIARIRAEMAFWGHDLSHFSDDEIEQGVLHTADVMRESSLTVEEASAAVYEFFRAFDGEPA